MGEFVSKFASLSLGDATRSSGCVSWLYYSIHFLPLVTQVTESCTLSLNSNAHFHLSLSMFPSMSCDTVASLMLVTTHNFHLLFVYLPPTPFSRTIYEFWLLRGAFQVHFHQKCLCKLFCREVTHLEHFSLFSPSCTNT